MNQAAALRSSPVARWAAVWTALAIYAGSWLATIHQVEERGAAWNRPLAIQLGSFLLWGLLAAPMVLASRRLAARTGGRLAVAAGLAALALAAALAHSIVLAALLATTLPFELWATGFVAGLGHAIRFQLHFNLLIAGLVLFAEFALGWTRRAAERRLEAARLETRLAQARLAASRVRLRPRFLFDALATVRRRLGLEPRAAESLVLQLASLLRAVLESWRHPESTVRDELELARIFVALERARLGSRLELAIEAEPGALELELPSLLVVSLLDDAVAAAADGATRLALTLEARRGERDGSVTLVVGAEPRFAATAPPFSAETLAVARERLAELFGADSERLTQELASDGTIRLALRLPTAAGERFDSSITSREVLWSRS